MGTNLIPSNRDHLIREVPVPLSATQIVVAAGVLKGFIAQYPGTVRGFQIYARDSGTGDSPVIEIQKNGVAIGSAEFATVADGEARSANGVMSSNDYVAGDRIEIVVADGGGTDETPDSGNLLVDTDIVRTFA